MTQEKVLLSYLADEYPKWIEGFRLHGSTAYGFLGSRTERTCRDLRSEGKLESRIIGKYVCYRIKKEVSPIIAELAKIKEKARTTVVQPQPKLI